MSYKMKGFSGFKNSPVKQNNKCYVDETGKKICPPIVDRFDELFPKKKEKSKEKEKEKKKKDKKETDQSKMLPMLPKDSPLKQDELAAVSESTSTIKPPKIKAETKLDQYIKNQKSLQNIKKKDTKVDSTLNQFKKVLSKRNALVNLLTN